MEPCCGPQIKAVNGKLKDVVLAPVGGGAPVQGTTSPDGSTWTTLEVLKFKTQYSYSFTVVDTAGKETKKSQTFTTVSAAFEADASIYPPATAPRPAPVSPLKSTSVSPL